MNSSQNPWLTLAANSHRKNFVLESELSIIEKFNSKVTDEYKIHDNIFPAPFMGDVHNAPVIILMLNPGYDKHEDAEGTNYYKTYENWWMLQIQHQLPYPKLPLFCLEEEYIQKSDYWFKKLKPLIDATSDEIVAHKIAKVQFFPYHSTKYKPLYKRLLKEEGFSSYLPSQNYNFELVRKAIQRDAILIIPRSKSYWEEAIPELKAYSNKYITKSYRNPILSKNNLGSASFYKILTKLK
ncbi:hypothetical protein FHG64_06440 [Antarcticibacterium flavum]|uniref:Uncharacterized protein n=1 Tax=Antarcticibacterium flavum TaxID=2058175 RepID=A0A5B7X356_9FLAO|nr:MULTISPECIES: hypothetical protein [Antarcticibacterium]MCM4161288.1 hypothetical protein [Antarcticibacterium sp. W02-3]QCY69073.1 hypothetical protein FHG64_06440 [Antarcticibacterium flavum]